MSHRRRGLGSAAGRVLAAALALSAGGAIVVGPAAAETLLDAVTLAYQTNPTLLAQRATQRATDEEYDQAMAGYRPTIGVTATDTQINGLDTQRRRRIIEPEHLVGRSRRNRRSTAAAASPPPSTPHRPTSCKGANSCAPPKPRSSAR